MTTVMAVGRTRHIVVLAIAFALPTTGAWAQLQPNESQPGGVELLPKPTVPAPMPSASAPAPATAIIAPPSKAAVPVDAKKAKDDGKDDKGDSKKSKKFFKKSTTPDSMGSRSAPAAPTTSDSAPAIPGDESRPGGVERAPTVPQPKQ